MRLCGALWLLATAVTRDVTAVITSQGMQEEAERKFEGWITGQPDDYLMSAHSKRKVDSSGNRNKVELSGGGKTNVEFTGPWRPTGGNTSQLLEFTGPWRPTGGNTSQLLEENFTYKKGPYPGFPNKVLGMYILLADDTEKGYGTDEDWEPLLHPYQQNGSNVLFFTFINPETMKIPRAFKKLAATRGTEEEGAVPGDTLIIFAIGGYQYSISPNPWHWLTSKTAAEDMAVKVAKWRDLYGIDGIDLDIEEGAGFRKEAGPNLLHFIRKLKSIHSDLLVGQPTYGYPQVQAEIDVINGSWMPGGDKLGLADSVGLMVYEDTQALLYVKNYASGSTQWVGFPIKVDVPKPSILLGCKGASSSASITALAREAVKQDLLGVMVWYCSVRNGLKYAATWDCSGQLDSEKGYMEAMRLFNEENFY